MKKYLPEILVLVFFVYLIIACYCVSQASQLIACLGVVMMFVGYFAVWTIAIIFVTND